SRRWACGTSCSGVPAYVNSAVVTDVHVVAMVRAGEGRAGAVYVEAVDELGGHRWSGQLGERRRQLSAGRGWRGVGAGDAVDRGDVHRTAEVMVGDVAFAGVLGVVGAQGRDRDLVRLGDRPEQADDA